MSHPAPSEVVVKEYTAEFSLGSRTQLVFFHAAIEEENALHKLALDALAPKVKTSVDAWRLERLWCDWNRENPIYVRGRSLSR